MPPSLSQLINPLVTPQQLLRSASQLHGMSRQLEEAVRYRASSAIQAVGILLRLPQQMIAQAIVIYLRFWLGTDGGSLLRYNAQDIAAAALYLVAKPGPYPLSPRQVLNAFFYVVNTDQHSSNKDARIPLYSEGSYQQDRATLIKMEAQILRKLGFQTHVALPHNLCVSYLQALRVLPAESGQPLARRACSHLNSALFSPQLLYLTHQPNALAVAAIYLAARETGMNLPEEPWWEVFDVDREELGFLVVALTSMDGFVEDQSNRYSDTPLPLTALGLRSLVDDQD